MTRVTIETNGNPPSSAVLGSLRSIGRIIRINYIGGFLYSVHLDETQEFRDEKPAEYTVGDLIEYLNSYDLDTPVYSAGPRAVDVSQYFHEEFCYTFREDQRYGLGIITE